VLDALPYTPTGAQTRALSEIAADMAAPRRMNRLLQGDVGAGKTLVAFIALDRGRGGRAGRDDGADGNPRAAASRGVAPAGRGGGCAARDPDGARQGAERAAKLAALAAGEIQILVGTHAVFQKDVEFADLRLAIVDEQHRFGVRQRLELGPRGRATDVLVMTATPIPRTLSAGAIWRHGCERAGRKTARAQAGQDGAAVSRADGRGGRSPARAIAEGRQAYWVCPLVEEARSRLSRRRSGSSGCARNWARASCRAGPWPDAARPRRTRRWPLFRRARHQVLVATTVIEVGVDVPNASIMVIERRRASAWRSCTSCAAGWGAGGGLDLPFALPLAAGETAKRRLMDLRETEDGFRIAEEDLAMRGAGDLIGTAQSGLPRFRIADLETQTPLMALAQSGHGRFWGGIRGLKATQGTRRAHPSVVDGTGQGDRLIRAG
jgi:ATP-dependent DNA helicase RecG